MDRSISFYNKFFVIVCLGFFCISASGDTINKEEWQPEFSNSIAAVVENHIITTEELRREIAPIVPQIRRESRSSKEFHETLDSVTRDVLQGLVDRILLIEDFKKKGFKVPESYFEHEYKDYIMNQFGGDRARFLEYLKFQNKTVRQFRKEFEEELILSFMRSRMRKSLTDISPEKIEEYYRNNPMNFFQKEAVRLRQIMLYPYANESTDLLMQEADKIVMELSAGKDFSLLAKQYSQDEKKNQGGDWGWINRSDIRPELAEVAFSLEDGQHSQPILVGKYIFILNVDGKRPEGVQPIEEVRDEIEAILAKQFEHQAQERFLEQLRKRAYIKYYL